jgi:methylmalonyl-CoA/ethylmalonyl-CoA epimerase
MSAATFGPIRQIAWVVGDLDASVRNWLRSSGVGPWTCFRNVAMAGTLRGQKVTVRMHVALGYQDGMEIELIEPLIGMHHVARFSEDVAAEVARGERCGLQVLFAAANEVTQVAYLEDPREPGLLLEFIEMNATMQAGLEQRLAAARSWRGDDPIRSIDLGG